MEGPSWAQLEGAANTTPKKIIRELQYLSYMPTPYEDFVTLLEKAINFSITTLTAAKNIIAGKGGDNRMDEDQLTFALSLPLKGMGFDITHSTNIGGNCDIVVVGPDDFLWLGEAKIFTSYGKLVGGFQQLSNRYATGLEHQSRGAMIIYMFGQKISDVMSNWNDYLKDAFSDLEVEAVPNQSLQFRTKQPHPSTGQTMIVCHMPVPLLHQPTDPLPPPPRKRKTKNAGSPELSGGL